MSNKLLLSIGTALLLASFNASALPEDANQPIRINADSAVRNDNTGITIYRGDVELKQGSMIITGDEIELRQAEGTVTKVIARGKPAHFQQRPTPEDEVSHAYGKLLDYNVRVKELEITGQAKVTQGSDSFSGNRIIYNMVNSTVKAFSDQQNPGQRVHMVIQPKAESETTPATAPASKEPDTQ